MLIRTIARAFALLVALTEAPRLARAFLWAALIVSASEATAQLPTGDTSANSIFRGCKALLEGRTRDAQLYALGNFCGGIVIGLASVGKDLPLPEWQSYAPTTSNVQQLARVVVDYIEGHPERMGEAFRRRRLTLEAFHDAWPCKSGR